MDENKHNYKIDELQIRVINDDASNKIYVIFKALMETQFYSPGVKTSRDDKNNISIEFIRTGIQNKDPEIDLKAEYLSKWINENNLPESIKFKLKEHSTSADQIFVISGKIFSLYVTDGKNKKIIWTKSQ
jgi:hypothetical protein